MDLSQAYDAAAEAIRSADAMLIAAGAGMGVDSGLPDFRGPEGFWKAYPPFKGRQFSDLSTPHWFETDPALAWGFFGHRLNLYRSATPHAGFEILRRWATRMSRRTHVFTSNVDGQFQKAGFPADSIDECHGSIHWLQCIEPCTREIWSSADVQIEVDPETIRTQSEFPRCPACGQIARPNILMFGDGSWVPDRTEAQVHAYLRWLESIHGARLVVVELGAGLAVPTVRYEAESQRGTLIRINPREAATPVGGIAIPEGALAALEQIDRLL
jgi:NAD-dependent SIR2 family protein deacetylase